jgi:hypothetical protein
VSKCVELITPPSSASAQYTWSYTSTPHYVFTVWCLDKHRDNFTFRYFYSSTAVAAHFFKARKGYGLDNISTYYYVQVLLTNVMLHAVHYSVDVILLIYPTNEFNSNHIILSNSKRFLHHNFVCLLSKLISPAHSE